MKVLHALGWYFPDSLGGTEVYVSALCERQASFGHEVMVAAPSSSIQKPSERYQHGGASVFRYRIPIELTRDEAQHRTPARGSETLCAFLETEKPDILHVHAFVTGLSYSELVFARELGIRVVVTNHLPSLGYLCQRGSLMRWGEFPCDGKVTPYKCASCVLNTRLPKQVARLVAGIGMGWPFRLSGKLGTTLSMPALIRSNVERQEQVIAACDRFVVLNRNAAEILESNLDTHGKLRVNALGMEGSDIAKKSSAAEHPTESPVRFGYLGRMDEGKGVLVLARAWSKLSSELNLELELRGPAESADEKIVVSQAQAMLASDSRVCFRPTLSREEVFDWLREIDVLLVPSLLAEGGPTVVFEAHAVGTPVIGTRIGAMPEAIRHRVDGEVLEPGDWQSLSRLIAEVARDPAGSVDRWRGELLAPRTMDEVASDYEALYRECLNG